MKNEVAKLLLALMAKTLNKPESELMSAIFVAEADGTFADDAKLKPDALAFLSGADADRVKALGKTERESGYSRGKSESLTTFETELRDLYGIKEAKTGKELVEAIVEVKAAGAKDKKITDDEVKKHPLYISLQDAAKQDKEKAVKEVQDQFEAHKKGIEKEKVLGRVVTDAKSIIMAGKYILSADAAKAERQLQDLYRDMNEFQFEYQKDATGKERVVLLDKDGKVVNDAHGHPVTFEGKVKELADARWDVQPADPRSGSGNQNPGNGTGQQQPKPASALTYEWKGAIPKNDDEYVKMMEKTPDENEQVALTKAYEASKAAV